MNRTRAVQSRSEQRIALPLLGATAALQIAHVLVVLFASRRVLFSNYAQLLMPLLVAAVCLHQRWYTPPGPGRLRWLAVGSAFGIWALGQAFFAGLLYHPSPSLQALHPDDALWVLFGLPLMLVLYSTGEEKTDSVGVLDRVQATVFVAVLYLLVFLPSVKLRFETAYNIQDFALVLCSLLRLPLCTSALERRFYLRLSLFLLAYGPLSWLGFHLYAHGWATGSLVDLVWTLPMAVYVVLVIRGSIGSKVETQGSRLVVAARQMHGLGVTTLAFLSLGVSAVLASHRPLLGGAFVAGAFALFALRTNARERALHHAQERLEESVWQDALTGLGNRLLLRNRLTERLTQSNAECAAVLLFVDLDRFKSINDSLGHALGDRLLIEVGKRLAAAASPDSIVCRLGGDEFVVLTFTGGPDDAQAAGTAVLEALHVPFRVGQHDLRCTASIGVVVAAPGEGADDLLRTADHAMYRAKQLGKNRVQMFDASLRAEMNSRWQMESELRICVEHGTIDVAFQPIFALGDGKISGFEALARWSHPQRGPVPPSDFIPLAEETGLILQLGAQILEKACRQMAEWNERWGTDLSVSVNVSPRQFSDTNLLPMLLDILGRTGLHARLLRLEITETALLVHESTVKQTLAQARAHGMSISLDDFGTGYSSLSFLLSLPVDEVKVDRSFVSQMHEDPAREELVRTVIHLGRSLGKRVVAEGVETEQDLRMLTSMGCESVQGWLLSKPLPPAVLETALPAIVARVAHLVATRHEIFAMGAVGRRQAPDAASEDHVLRSPALESPAFEVAS